MTRSLLPSGSFATIFVFGYFLIVKLGKRLSMGKNPIDYNKLRELGMKVLTVSLQSLGFIKSIADKNLYIKIVQNHPVILG